MPTCFGCSQGHHWEALPGGPAPACPVCGAAGQARAEADPSLPDVETLRPNLVPPPVPDVAAPTCREAAPAPEPGDCPEVAGYQILGLLGRGGMGVVYQARQLALNRLVALKMILGGANASPQQLARFHLEAEAIAGLQHPHIVQVYEVGQHAHGPYLALEFIDGPSLDENLAGHPRPPRQAAQMVETLARAVHTAHLRGVIHRDLKPANVLLTRDGLPKITDFGLAKRLGEEERRTWTGSILGTPSYMAPEQAAGKTKEIGPLADVYGLGAILYHLLTGRPPFGAASVLETLQQVQFQEPVAPTRLQRKVPRDLETICLKCLQKEPRKRYGSALDLAEDLRRFLAGEPIRARPVGPLERVRKWARRRPTAAALIVLTGLAVVGLAAGLAWHTARLRSERDAAERNLRRALRAVDQMLTEVAEEQLAEEPRMEEKRRILLEKALAFYQEFLEEKRADPGVRRETGRAYKRMGAILRLLGRYNRARAAYEQAIALLRQLAADFPLEPAHREELAACYNDLGEVFRLTSQPREARAPYTSALRLQQQLVAGDAARLGYQLDLARTHYNLGILLREDNHAQDAEKSLTRAITLLKQLVNKDPDEPRYRQHLARSYLNLGPVLRGTNRPRQAEKRYRQAIALLEKLADQYPDNPNYRHELGVCFLNLGNLLAGSHTDRAEKAFTSAVRRFRRLAKEFPRVPVYRQELANGYNSLGKLLNQKGDPSAARKAWEQARGLFQQLADERRDVPTYRGDLGMVYGNLGWLLAAQEDWKAARPYLEKAVAYLKGALKPPHSQNPDYQGALRDNYQTLAVTFLKLKNPVGAAAAAAALPTVFPDRGLDYYYAACFTARCVPLTQKPALRRRWTAQAIDLLRKAAARGVAKDKRLKAIEAKYLQPLHPALVRKLLLRLDRKAKELPRRP
jgi:tetratricopeptide (TPR) repeat protein